jgi:hypothetical protein
MKLNASLAAGLLLLVLLGCGNARAMSFYNFTKMNDDDDASFVAMLVEGTAKLLRANGHADEASQLIAFFKDSSKEGGLNQLVMNAKMMNALNQRNAINPNNRVPVYEVEDAMERTLHDKGIVVPASSLRTITRDFKPSGPPRAQMPTH